MQAITHPCILVELVSDVQVGVLFFLLGFEVVGLVELSYLASLPDLELLTLRPSPLSAEW